MAVVVGRAVEWTRLGARTATLASRASIGHGDKEQIGVARREVLGASYKTTYDKSLLFLRAEKQYMYNEDGRQYLDAYNNVPHVGHCHPRVVEAAYDQMRMINSNTRYMHANPVNYANRLRDLMPSSELSVCYLVNSGSEANDLALRLSLAYTQNRDVLCHDAAYHGTTMACAWMSPCEHYNASEHLRRPKWLQVLAKPDPFRGVYSRDEYDEGSGELASRYVADAHAVIADRAKKGHRVAACLVESIMGVGGQVIYPKGYVQELAKVVRAGGGLMVADEVQTGLGRTGTAMWAFEEQGYTPDIVTMGKPMGNGFPIAAVFTSRAISQAFTESGEYFNTFGGSQVASAVGIAVLDVLEDEGLVENANTIGKYLMKKLSALKEKHPEIGDVRGSGLFIGLEFVVPGTKEPDAAACMATVNKVKENGILTGYDGPDQNILRIKPPMCFSKANAKQLLAALDTALTMRRLKEEHLTPEFEDEAAATSPLHLVQ